MSARERCADLTPPSSGYRTSVVATGPSSVKMITRSADPEEIAQDWIEHMFGPGAAHMAAFYDAVAESIRGSGQSFSDNPPRHVPGLYSDDHLERADPNTRIDALLTFNPSDFSALCWSRSIEMI